ncbi:MAG: HU family DNA-binding protein [Bacillota bacterium]|nr:HU family DNA-binding protein [Bacillota bacterium]
MTKSELISKVAATTGFTKKDAGLAVEAVFKAITESLSAGTKVSVVGFGTFGVRRRAGRVGRNPRTNRPMKIEPRTAPVFKAGRLLKESVSGK